MVKIRRVLWIGLLFIFALVLAACGGGGGQVPDDTGGSGGGEETGGEETGGESGGEQPAGSPAPTLAAGEVHGIYYVGEVLPPQKGKAAFYVHFDSQAELLVVIDDNPGSSLILHGTLEGQHVNAVTEEGNGRAAGRITEEGFEFNVTIPGKGFMRATVTPAEEGGMYIGTFNDFQALFAIFPDGSTAGLALVEGGDNPVYAFLCVDPAPEGTPETVAATLCDSDEEVELTLDTD